MTRKAQPHPAAAVPLQVSRARRRKMLSGIAIWFAALAGFIGLFLWLHTSDQKGRAETRARRSAVCAELCGGRGSIALRWHRVNGGAFRSPDYICTCDDGSQGFVP